MMSKPSSVKQESEVHPEDDSAMGLYDSGLYSICNVEFVPSVLVFSATGSGRTLCSSKGVIRWRWGGFPD